MNFESVYIEYFARMKRFAMNYVSSETVAEGLVQEVFAMLWERNIDLSAQSNLTAYLLTILKNKCLDYLKHKKVEWKYSMETILMTRALEEINTDFYSDTEIAKAIKKSIENLPEKCRKIFIKSKIDGKKNKEIALDLNISISTVENQMSIAFKKLRKDLKGDLILLVLVLESVYKGGF